MFPRRTLTCYNPRPGGGRALSLGSPFALDAAMPIRSILRSFAHRNFRLFFAGQCLSLVGTQVQIVALPWFVYRLTDSPEWNGWVAFAGQFPAVFATPLAGV